MGAGDRCATILNTGTVTATACSIAFPPFTSIGTLHYQRTNAQNVPIGSVDTPVDIAAGQGQTFVFSITPTTVPVSTEMAMVFKCTNSSPAPVVFGLNTFLLTIGSSAITDMLSIAETLTHDGIVNIPGVDGTGLMVTAAVDIGAGGTVTCAPTPTPVGQPPRNLPVNLSICQTDSSGTCINPATPGPSATVNVIKNQTVFFSIFAQGQGQNISFDPSNKRAFFICTEGSTPVGEASVAVRTQ